MGSGKLGILSQILIDKWARIVNWVGRGEEGLKVGFWRHYFESQVWA